MGRAKLAVLFLFGAAFAVSVFPPAFTAAQRAQGARPPSRTRLGAFRANNCVTCHATLSEPVRTSAHFYEWLNSKHERSGVGCEKCHGGDPAAKDFRTAHAGVLRAAFPQSTLHAKKVAATCSSCHEQAASAFVKSRHARALAESGDAPSCTTCHHHMATSAITWPPDTANLCARCHNQSGGPAAKYLQVPTEAGDTIAAFSRAEASIEWGHYLIKEVPQGAVKLKAEREKLRRLEQVLKEAKLNWHEFNLKRSREQADQVFGEATRLRDGVWPKVP
jgi:hypothetical protein